MNAPVRLQISRTGEIWAAGSHGNIAATAYWDGQTWRMTQHPELSWGIDYRAVFEDWQGALWFGAAIDFEPEKGQLGGALRIKDHQITHLTSVLSSNFMAPYGIGQAKDNSIWFGGIYGLFRMDRSGIAKISEPTALTQQSIDVIYTSPQNDLWIGTRYFGIFRFDIIHSKWLSFNLNNGLSSNKIIDITITDDERIWTATNVGYDCYDGKRWTPGALPSIWHLSQDGGSLKTSTDGSIWINQTSKAWNRRAWPETPALKNYDFRTLRYKPDRTPPHTWLFETEKEIPQPGNAVFTWYGSDPWNNTAPTKIQYSWRLDNSEWSQFSTIDNHVFFKLPSGSHTFEVKSRDLDLNEDPTPALIHFTVLPPVWRQPWFISLITVLTGIICFQTIRIIRRDLKLHETNKYLARERSIEHLRAVFMSIRSIRDISESIRELGNEIKAAAIEHNAICIYFLDEANGILYQFEMMIPDNQVQQTEFSLDSISSIFLSKFHSTTQLVQPVSQNLIPEILLAKESSPLQVAFSQAKFIMESSFENGILLISTPQNEGFSDDESKTIKGYLAVIAAGYAKYLSLRKIEKQQSELMRIQLATIQERLENELMLERLEKEKERQVALLKQQFFTDISHEFRTPLTLILSPLQKIITQIEQKNWLSDQISIIHKNAERLLRLVNQLLDFRKLEEGCLTIDLSQGDLIKFIKNIADTFIPTADEKGILFQFSTNQENLLTWFDPDKIDKIIYNLLCNAFKFTPENGKIIISINVSSDTEYRMDNYQFVEISVTDNGIGIPSEDHKRIFERFYQVSHQLPCETKGSGIGLALTKELIELLGGSITVESEPGKGATFWVRLPIIEKVVLEDESAITRIKKADNNHEKNDSQKITSELFIESAISAYPTKPKILLVEDNDDVRSYVRDDLSDQYDIAEASNGTEGLKTARKIIPDLIITDIIMPDLDGIELCKILKNDVRTSHIPIILLTARSTKEDEAQGLAIGADDYIVKPFNVSILKARVKNLILSRQQLRERFSRDIKLEPENIYITSVDEKFLTRVIKVIDENMDDSEFGVEKLSQIVKMNRVQLYRKIKSLTNHTVNDFIRILRLKRAAQLLKESKLTVTEIAFEVGFSDSSNFARDFRKHFGTTPSLYARQRNENKDSSL